MGVTQVIAPMSVLPEPFLTRLVELMPDQLWGSVLASFGEPKNVTIRINTLRTQSADVRDRLTALGLTPLSLPWFGDAFVLPGEQRATLLNSASYHQGEIYLQNASSLLPPVVLDPQPGEEVLDMAAAPGSKTLQIACAMGGSGRIAAVEAVRHRFFKLKANLAAQGAAMVRCYHADAATLWRKVPERFDRILLDAPCSSESRFRESDPESFGHWSLRKVEEMARKQKQLLHSAVRCLKPGGVLVYSTCSFSPEENEAVISRALEVFGAAIRVESFDMPAVLNSIPGPGAAAPQILGGLCAWRNAAFDPSLAHAMRVVPDASYDGFFVCRLRKLASTDNPSKLHVHRSL